jgi:NTP pyrophosphatase (non-canonical NTP hydrolase)
MTDCWTDNKLRSDILTFVDIENMHQLQKWGVQTHSPFEWLTYTTEELGELAKAISEHVYRNGRLEDVIKEAIQTATLALKIAEMAYLKTDPLKVTEK